MRIDELAASSKLFLFTIILISSFNTISAQTKEDFDKLEELKKKRAEIYRTIYQSEELKNINKKYKEIIARSNSYGAFTFGWEISKADIKKLNADATASGLPTMDDKFHSFVFGYSRMNRRLTGDLLVQLTFPKNIESGTHTVTLSGAGISWDKGYAIVSTENIILFPFAGIGWQTHTLRVSQKNNPVTVNNLLDISQASTSGDIYKGSWYGSLGAQLDVVLPGKKRKDIAWHTGIRFAYNPTIIKGKYKYSDDDLNYNPDIKWREFQLSVLFKIAGKTYYPYSLFRGFSN